MVRWILKFWSFFLRQLRKTGKPHSACSALTGIQNLLPTAGWIKYWMATWIIGQRKITTWFLLTKHTGTETILRKCFRHCSESAKHRAGVKGWLKAQRRKLCSFRLLRWTTDHRICITSFCCFRIHVGVLYRKPTCKTFLAQSFRNTVKSSARNILILTESANYTRKSGNGLSNQLPSAAQEAT